MTQRHIVYQIHDVQKETVLASERAIQRLHLTEQVGEQVLLNLESQSGKTPHVPLMNAHRVLETIAHIESTAEEANHRAEEAARQARKLRRLTRCFPFLHKLPFAELRRKHRHRQEAQLRKIVASSPCKSAAKMAKAVPIDQDTRPITPISLYDTPLPDSTVRDRFTDDGGFLLGTPGRWARA